MPCVVVRHMERVRKVLILLIQTKVRQKMSVNLISLRMAARIAATILSFVETCKLMKKNVLGFLKDFFDMVVSGKTDYDQMALDILGVNKK